MILCKKFNTEIKDGVSQIADTMKMLVYNEVPEIFDNIDFENDTAFLEPLLFSYFNRVSDYPIYNILCGYFKNNPEKEVNIVPNKNGVTYIPQIGYFSSVIPLNRPDKTPIYLSNGIELLTQQHPLLENEFKLDIIITNSPVAFLTEKQINSVGSVVEVEIDKTTQIHFNHVQQAFNIIKEYLPELHDEILLTNRKIVLFNNPSVLSFVTMYAHGTSFITTIPENGVIFFIEEIIHQCSHNTFNALLFKKDDFFKINVEETVLGNLIGREDTEHRTVYSVFHGFYTVIKRYEAFYSLYLKDIFTEKEKHEFLGRFADLKKRSKLGLELLDHSSVFTEKGLQIYNYIEEVSNDLLSKTTFLDGMFDFSNQPSEFSYKKFCLLNPLK